MKRKILTGFLMILLLMSPALADGAPELCTDSDDGPDDGRHPSDDVLTTKGSTKYGIRTSKDICVVGKDTDVYAEESAYLKEFYCDNDKREFVIFDCRDYGFEKCVDGACVGAGNGNSGTDQNQQTTTRSSCGNKILEKDKGEECDPPGSICLEGADYGMCLENCKCRWHSQVESGTDEEKEENETKEDIQEEIEQPEEQEEKEEDKIEVPDIGERKDFTKEPGIKVTTGIAGFFKKIWNWFKGLFS